MKTVYALFASYEDARSAVEEILGHGLSEDDMNVLVDAAMGEEYLRDFRGMIPQREPGSTTPLPTGQSLFGLDYLLAGRRPVRLPDERVLIASGPLAATAVKTTPGERKSLRGALRDLGLDENFAQTIVNGVGAGKIFFWVRCRDDLAGPLRMTFGRWHAEHTGILTP